MINYGIVYGLTDYGLADRLNIPREEAKEFIDAYLARFPRSRAFMQATIEQATEQGYVTTLFGRRRTIPELRARNFQVRSLGERLAVNTVDPGHRRRRHQARDDRRRARAARPRAWRRGSILTIHDELLFEGPPEEMDAVRALAEREMVAPWGDRDAAARGRRRRRADLAGGQVGGPHARPRSSSWRPAAAVGAQAPINGALGRVVGSWQAALVNFAVGLLILTRRSSRVAAGGFGGLRGDPDACPGGRCCGGACGVAVVTSLDLRRSGTSAPAASTAAVVAGQLTASVRDRPLRAVRRRPSSRSPPGKLARHRAARGSGVYLIVRRAGCDPAAGRSRRSARTPG